MLGTKRRLVAPLGIASLMLLALPAAAFANTTQAIAQTGGMTVEIPMLGSPLAVGVKIDVVGNITQVVLDPSGSYSASKLGPHAVTFDSAGNATQVSVKAKDDKLKIGAKAGSLDALVGTGSWSADVFGTGELSSLEYKIEANPDGSPNVTIGPVSAPVTIDVTTPAPTNHVGPHDAKSKATVVFAFDGFTKKLTIEVTVKEKGDKPASLTIQLSGKDKQKLAGALADLLGGHSWSGHLCDGTAVGFTYDVVDPGTLAFGSATGAPATEKVDKHGQGFSVRFDGTKTTVKVKLNQKKDGTWELKVDTKLDKCRHTPAADPTVSTPVKDGATNGHDGHDTHDNQGDKHDQQGGDANLTSFRTGWTGSWNRH